MLSPVVVGVDGSAESLAATDWAAREAERSGRDLRLCHACNGRPSQARDARDEAARQAPARRALSRARERARARCPGLRLEEEQVGGPATAALLKASQRAGLLVLGSRGLSGFTGFLVGSVALGTVARAACPVVLVRAGEGAGDEHLPAADGSGSHRAGYGDVVLGLDVAAPCDEVIAFAFEEARLRHARLRAVYAWQQPSAVGLGPGDIALVGDPLRAEEWQGFLSAVLRVWRDKHPEVEVVETVVREKPSTALVRASSGASLLVVGRRPAESPTGARIGPVTHAAVRHVGCPVAVVPHG
ncbi:universal stress protein [Streptomyces sp. NPDC003393]